MAKELPYFKFFVSEWILGRISDHSDKVQGAFIVAICHYWNKECNYNRIDFERKIGKKRFKMLLDLKFFEVENEMIYIDFLDEQHAELSDIHKVRVKGGLARAEQVRQQKASYIDKDKIIEDKDKDKINIKSFFESLLNGSELEIIAMNNKITLNQAKECVELFRPKSEVTYPTYAKFVSHFKNWLNKNPYKDPNVMTMVR